MRLPQLPVTDALPALKAALATGSNAILMAPPGAGKTTLVPLVLLEEPWLERRKIIMLEPRRLATRAAAHRMSHLIGSRVGGTVGYRVRRDTRVGPATRIEVVTEGILTRMLNSDPTLAGVGLVIFDEFHERSLQADLGLALTLHSQRLVRPDLRILVMSATVDPAPIAGLLGMAPVIASAGRAYPLEVRYIPPRSGRRFEELVASAIDIGLRETAGDLLVFLPGQAEIRRVARQLNPQPGIDVHQLFGNLSFADQDRAIAPSPAGHRKIVLATSIAESSLTIEGVRCVIDAGLARVPRFAPRSGMTELATVRVSRASADQRAGRAAREAPGMCLRLWPAEEQAHLVPFVLPEIVEGDLAPLVLELTVAGVTDPAELLWLDPPSPARVAQARALLTWLGAIDARGRASQHGNRMAALGAHPRLAHMLLRSVERGHGPVACDIAALLELRDVVQGNEQFHDADLRLRIELLNTWRQSHRVAEEVNGLAVSREAVARAAEESRAWRRTLGVAHEAAAEADTAGPALALAFPDRVAQQRPGTARRYVMRSGAGAALRDSPALASASFLAIAMTDGRSPEAQVFLAAPLDVSEVVEIFADQIQTEESVAWDASTRSVRALRRELLDAIVLRTIPVRDADPALVKAAMIDAIRNSGLALLEFTDAAVDIRERANFLHAHDPAWPEMSDPALLSSLDDWLGPSLDHVRTASDLRTVDLPAALASRLDWSQRSRFGALAPTHFVAPTGSRIPISYSDPMAPVVRVRLQEMFGCVETPSVFEGRVPILLHLLSPAHRPVQVTRDLRSFWTSSYADVRKDLRGRYPRHYWPEDPLTAEPTRRAKKRGE